MSCTHDCGCSAETRDARTDDWGHTSPLSPQNADLREFQPAEPSQPLGDVPASERPREAVLPRPITPEDVRVGMVVERRKGEVIIRGRVDAIGCGNIDSHDITLWYPDCWRWGWQLWLVEDAPQVDEDAALVEVMAEAVWRSVCGPHAQWPDGPGSPSDSDDWRESSRAAIVAARAAGYRIEATR